MSASERTNILQGAWSHDIRDPVAFVSHIVSRSSVELDYHRRERLHQFLLITLWEISRDFRPGGVLFSTYAGNILPRRIIDWQRTPEEGGRTSWTFSATSGINSGYRGRTIERVRPDFVPLEDREGEAERASTVDAGHDRLSSVLGLDGARDRRVLRTADTLGTNEPRRAA